ncbi:cation:proton antiporter [candidate division WOR-3 bacterium]|nr:cation:proton antiporter [candidate division WOR-3 bacterium]
MTGNPFVEIAAILAVSTVLGVLGRVLKQPLIIMFLVAGILAGPSGFKIIESHEQIELLSQMGVALLLFIVGLKLDLKLIKTIGPVALATGLGQIVFTSVFGLIILLVLGLDLVSSAYAAVALTFSSTIIIVKLLSDKKEIDSLHGQIAIGFLIVQDIAAIIALVALTTLRIPAGKEISFWESAFFVFAKGMVFFLIVGLLMRYVLPWLTKKLAQSMELLTLFAIAWAVVLGAAGEYLGFSKEVGAFLAGFSLASTEFRDSIGARLTTLRDFLLLFFFIELGARLDVTLIGSGLALSILLSIFVLIGNPVIVMVIMGLMGYRRRTGFLSGLAVAQISEFSLIVISMGYAIGHISKETVGVVTFVGVVTIFFSTYMILYSNQLYKILSRPLKLFERKNPHRESAIDFKEEDKTFQVILVGLGNYGSGIAEELLHREMALLGVDFDPESLQKWRSKNIPVIYGDITDPEIHEQLPLDRTKWVVSSIRDRNLNSVLINLLKEKKFMGKVAVTASNKQDAEEYEKSGAHLVFRTFSDAAEQAADSLTYAMELLPKNIDWPIEFAEVRIRSDSSEAGKMIKNIPLRSKTGVSVLAVVRAGNIDFEVTSEKRVFPGDRLIIAGNPENLKEAEQILNRFDSSGYENEPFGFEIAEIEVSENSVVKGTTLAEFSFRQKFGATVVGILREEKKITKVNPDLKILAGDKLVVIGTSEALQKLKKI